MKKIIALLTAAALTVAPIAALASETDEENKGTAVTPVGGFSFGIGTRQNKEIKNTEVTNTGSIDLGTITRENKTIENTEVTGVGSIDLGTITRENKEIKNTEVTNTGSIDLGTITRENKEIENTEVTNTGSIDLGTISRENKEIENTEVTDVGSIDLGTITRENKTIENTQVTAVEIDLGVLFERHNREIENVAVVNNGEIDLGTLSYAAREITQSNVMPVGDINLAISQFNAPDIRGQIPVEVEPFYANLFTFAGEAGRAQMVAMTDIELAGFVRTQYEIINELVKAFELAGITIEVDEISGMIRLESSLLYATNEYQVTPEGKKTLSEIMRIYCSVLTREEYRDQIGRVIIAGHTDTAGTYEYNVGLSQRRAEAVKDFCLSPECGLEDVDWLAERVTAKGYSYDRLIFNADGSVNMDASRRVEIGFTLKMN